MGNLSITSVTPFLGLVWSKHRNLSLLCNMGGLVKVSLTWGVGGEGGGRGVEGWSVMNGPLYCPPVLPPNHSSQHCLSKDLDQQVPTVLYLFK